MIPETMKPEEIQEIENQIVNEVESGADTDNATFCGMNTLWSWDLIKHL